MARKLYEKQAVRRRTGALANGVVLVVYTDAAGTVLADVSATLGGSAIAGSTVTTADIAGLGPASLRFYGPSDGTDILYMRVPSDASLGVQKIEADPDPRLDALESGSASGIPGSIFDAKGDIIAASAADTAARLAVGANDTVLTADSTTGTGLKWAAGGGSVAAHEADTTAIHGIVDTTQLGLKLKVGDSELYVSTSGGSDSNDGLSPGAAKATVAAAAAAIPTNGGVINLLGGGSGHHTLTATVVPKSRTLFRGFGNHSEDSAASVAVIGPALAGPLFDISNKNNVDFQGLVFAGNTGSGSKGIYASTCWEPTIRDCFFHTFGDQAIHSEAGTQFTIDHIFVQNALLVGSRSSYVGAVDIANSDSFVSRANLTASNSSVGTGWRAALVVRGTNSFITNSIGQISEVGMVITGDVCRVIGCRADLNYGHGFVVSGSTSEFVGNLAWRNGLSTDATYSGFVVSGAGNAFIGNRIDGIGSDANQHLHGFVDANSAGGGAAAANTYGFNRSNVIRGNLYSPTGTTAPSLFGVNGGAAYLQATQYAKWNYQTLTGAERVGLTADVTSGELYVDFNQGGSTGDVVFRSGGGFTERLRVETGGGLTFGGSAGPQIHSGAGTPEAAVTAPVGSLFLRSDGGAGTSLYVKQTGAGNTGWVGK